MYDKETRKMLEIECNDIENFYALPIGADAKINTESKEFSVSF
jgi:hypothetical protein